MADDPPDNENGDPLDLLDEQEALTPDQVAMLNGIYQMRCNDARHKIGKLEEQYSHDGNELDAWSAMALAHRVKITWPQWVLDKYLGEAAVTIDAMIRECLRTGKPPKNAEKQILLALGFNKGRGHRNVFAELIAAKRDEELFEYVMHVIDPNWWALDGPLEKLDYAYQVVAKEYDCDPSTVAKAVGRQARRLNYYVDGKGPASTMEEYVRRFAASRASRKGTK